MKTKGKRSRSCKGTDEGRPRQRGTKFLNYWSQFDNVSDYVADPLFKYVKGADFIENYASAYAAWDVIKLDPELKNYLSIDNINTAESVFQTLKNFYNENPVVE